MAFFTITSVTDCHRYEAFLKHEIFRLAGMNDSGFNLPHSVNLRLSARGYKGRKPLALAGRIPNGWGYRGSTGAITSTADLVKWIRALVGGKVLSSRSLGELFHDKKVEDDYGYALGWEVERDSSGQIVKIDHGGSTIGFQSYLSYFPREKVLLVSLSNQEDAGWVYYHIDQVLTGKVRRDQLDALIRRSRESQLRHNDIPTFGQIRRFF